MSGKRIGRWTVIRKDVKHKGNTTYWICRCDCGTVKSVNGHTLRNGDTLSCSCSIEKNYVGEKFGRLLAIERIPCEDYRTRYKCRCDCGKEIIVLGESLVSGNTQSCGCLVSESIRKRTTTHGYCGTRLYSIYNGMKDRCCNPKNTAYKNYGGRGITICEEWLNSFLIFKDWASNNGYADKLTIDRIDVNGNYEPSNCRWITFKEQQQNKQTTHYYEIGGEKKSISQWAEQFGIPYNKMYRYVVSQEKAR